MADPVTYYVATDGSDDNSGLAPETPFRTIQKAADEVNVGDTVSVGGGTYPEIVRIRATGTPTAPISFNGQPGELVMLDGVDGLIDFAFVIGKKSHLRFDNFFFSNHGAVPSVKNEASDCWRYFWYSGVFSLSDSRDACTVQRGTPMTSSRLIPKSFS